MACRCLQGGLLFHLPSAGSSRILLGTTPPVAVDSNRSSRPGRTIRLSALSTGGDLRPGLNDNPEGIISGEWPENFSLLSYDDLRAYLESQPALPKKRPSAPLGEVMSVLVRTVTVDQTLGEIDHHFQFVSGLPVVDSELRCVGIVCNQDRTKASHGLKTKIGEVMSSPAITLTPDRTVKDAATLMLKMKIHRIPIINEDGRVVGIVTRTDIYQAMEA